MIGYGMDRKTGNREVGKWGEGEIGKWGNREFAI